MTRHVMIDIETYGLSDNSVVIEIGAVVSFEGVFIITSSILPSIQEQRKAGRLIDPDTIKWWAQIDPLRLVADESKLLSVERSLSYLDSVCKYAETFWAKGDFDFRVLENLYADQKRDPPWKYSQKRDARTLLKATDTEVVYSNLHRGVRDAKDQMTAVLEAFDKIGKPIR